MADYDHTPWGTILEIMKTAAKATSSIHFNAKKKHNCHLSTKKVE